MGYCKRQLRDALLSEFSPRLPYIPLAFATLRMVVHPNLRHWRHGLHAIFGEDIHTWYFAR